MGNTSTKESESTSSSRTKSEGLRSASRPGIALHHPVSVAGRHGSTSSFTTDPFGTVAPTYTSAPTISKASSTSTSTRNYSNPYSPNYAPTAPPKSPSKNPVISGHVIPGTSRDPFNLDPFYLGHASRRVSATTETRGTSGATVTTTRTSYSNSSSTTPGSEPVLFWNSSTKSYTTKTPTPSNSNPGNSSSNAHSSVNNSAPSTSSSTNVTSSTSRVSGSQSAQSHKSTNNYSAQAWSTNAPISTSANKSVPTVPTARNCVASSVAPHHSSTSGQARAPTASKTPNPGPLPPLPSQNHPSASNSSRQQMHGQLRNLQIPPQPRATPHVRVYTPLNTSTPNFSAPEPAQNSTNSNGQQPSSGYPDSIRGGNRGRPFPRGRGRYRGAYNNNGDANGNYNGNGGRGRGRGFHRGNLRGGVNNNNQGQSCNSLSDNVRDNNATNQPEAPNGNQPTDANANTADGDINQRGRGRGFPRGRGRGNSRRGQGRRNRGGGPGFEGNTGKTGDSKRISAADLEDSQFECPICMEALQPPIYQCHNGHMVCSGCEAQIRQCAICREDMPAKKIRNLPIEQIVRGST